jgi:hypothetical protein
VLPKQQDQNLYTQESMSHLSMSINQMLQPSESSAASATAAAPKTSNIDEKKLTGKGNKKKENFIIYEKK